MAKLFTGSSAPFFFTLLISVFSWLANNTIERLDSVFFIHYDYDILEDSNARKLLHLNFHNSSSNTFSGGKFEFRCIPEKPETNSKCLRTLGQTNNVAQLVTGNSSIVADINDVPQTDDTSSVTFNAKIGPSGLVSYRIGLAKDNSRVQILYNATGISEIPNLVFTSGETWTGWFVRNYLVIIMSALILIVAILTIYVATLVFLARSSKKSEDEEKKASKYMVEVKDA